MAQIVDINDPATPNLPFLISPPLKGQILMTKSCSDEAKTEPILRALADLNQALDDLTHATGEQQIQQHRVIAEAIAHMYPSRNSNRGILPMSIHHLVCGAVVLGDLSLVKQLLEDYVSAETNDSDRRYKVAYVIEGGSSYLGRPLQLAAAWGHTELVQYLLDNGADPRQSRDNRIWEPHMYVGVGMTNVCRRPDGSALGAAVRGVHKDTTQLLLQPKYLISSKMAEYFRVIVAAGQTGQLDLLHDLVKATGMSLSHFPGLGEELLWHAAYSGQYEVSQMVLDSGIDVNVAPVPDCRAYGCALSIAACLGNVRMARFLLDRGADPRFSHDSQNHLNPIEISAHRGHQEVVELLLAHGADPLRAFERAADGGQVRIVDWLLKQYPKLHLEPSIDGLPAWTEALRKAILIKNPTIITMLVKHGVPLSHTYSDYGPIALAKRFAADWIVEFLLSLGAEDEEYDLRNRYEAEYFERVYSSLPERSKVRITKRTWEWVGKY